LFASEADLKKIIEPGFEEGFTATMETHDEFVSKKEKK